MDTDAKEEYELTSNPVDGTYGFICRTHGIHRAGLAHRHATNVEAKHVREQHTEDHALTLDLDLAGLARQVIEAHKDGHGPDASEPERLRAGMALTLWRTLTGLERDAALRLAEEFATAEGPVRAAVAPF